MSTAARLHFRERRQDAKEGAKYGRFGVRLTMGAYTGYVVQLFIANKTLSLVVAFPLAYRFSPLRLPALLLLWAVAGYALWQLFRDPSFERNRLWNPRPLPGQLAAILLCFAVVALVLWLAVRRWAPALEWNFLRTHPAFWAVVMVAYPVLSVYPHLDDIPRWPCTGRCGPGAPRSWLRRWSSTAARPCCTAPSPPCVETCR